MHAQKKWLKKNGGKTYFTDELVRPKNLERVHSWRARNPEYWRRKRAQKLPLFPKIKLPKKLAAKIRCVALQDTIDTRFALEIAIAIISQTLRYKIR